MFLELWHWSCSSCVDCQVGCLWLNGVDAYCLLFYIKPPSVLPGDAQLCGYERTSWNRRRYETINRCIWAGDFKPNGEYKTQSCAMIHMFRGVSFQASI